MLGEGQPQPQRGKAGLDHTAVIVLDYDLAAPSRRYHANGVTATKLARDGRARISHQGSIASRLALCAIFPSALACEWVPVSPGEAIATTPAGRPGRGGRQLDDGKPRKMFLSIIGRHVHSWFDLWQLGGAREHTRRASPTQTSAAGAPAVLRRRAVLILD